MASPEDLKTALRRVGAYELGHAILNSGLHSLVKVNVDSLADYPGELAPFLDDIEEKAQEAKLDVFVPVPNGGVRLLAAKIWTNPRMVTPQKVGKREFVIGSQEQDVVNAANRIGIFDDAVTTGGTPAAMARTIRGINPSAELHLFGMVRRGKVLESHAEMFASQVYLLEEDIPAWREGDCPNCGSGKEDFDAALAEKVV